DGQTQSRSPIRACCGAVGLRERFEDALLTVNGDADACVTDGEMQFEVWRHRHIADHAEDDLAVSRKLDGIPEQIDENLAQASGVPSQPGRNGRPDIHDELETLLVSLPRDGVRRVADGVVSIEVDRVERKLAGLDPGEVQDVVD